MNNQQELNLNAMADRMGIHDVLVRYCTAIDTLDYALLDSCFTADAHLDYSVMNGPADTYNVVRAWLEDSLHRLHAMQHSITNTVFDIDGDSAKTRTQFRNPNVMATADGQLNVFTVGGYYDDELIRTSDGWRIQQRVEVFSYVDGTLPGRS